MQGDDAPLDQLQREVESLRRELQEVKQSLMAIREMIEDGRHH